VNPAEVVVHVRFGFQIVPLPVAPPARFLNLLRDPRDLQIKAFGGRDDDPRSQETCR
jgi:hypothetical protein